ncbi:phostensin-like [Antechinus flavipes]|uniref:phostensin-like n=1 Tax=Antechinus flavipes TaxID=38775 RepID=UPI002236AB6D|nr:phostensin-like [Antechinus flavipes]
MSLNPGEESKGTSGEPRTEQNKSREKSGLLKTQEFRALSSGVTEAAERRLNPRENVKMSSGLKKAQDRLNSGKALKWCPEGSEAEKQKLEFLYPRYKKLQSPKAAEKQAGDEGRMVSSLRSHSSVTSFFLLEKVRIGNSGPQHPLPFSVPLLFPAPPIQWTPKSCLKILFSGIHSNLGSRPQATSLLPKPQLPGPGKKQYPTSEEVSVVGDYISLTRSCLAKSSSERRHKQLRISFKEPVLQSIYYYPSENSMLPNMGSILMFVSPPPMHRKRRRNRRNYCHHQGNMEKNSRSRSCLGSGELCPLKC